MSIEQQIAANEKTFQEWFQRSWDAHHKESPSAADFKDVGDPRPTTRQKSYDYLDKRTVRVMADLQSRPDDFVQLLQDYLINNALLLYQDSIRIANLPGSVSFYKDCGDQVGMVECHLSREGQVVTVSVGYQIWTKSIDLLANPDRIQTAIRKEQTKSKLKLSFKKSRLFNTRGILKQAFLYFSVATSVSTLSMCLMFLAIGLDSALLLFPALLYIMALVQFFARGEIQDVLSDKKKLLKQIDNHLKYDLSHSLFPVNYYSNDEVTATQNKDHAAFLERIRSVIDRAVAFGESSHNQRT